MYNSSDSEDDTLSGAEKELPQWVYFHKQTGKYRLQFSRGGKLHQSPYSTDIDWLVQWKADKNKELDEAGVPPTRKQKKRERAAFQSDTPGVRWDSEKKRWTGTIYDRLTLKTIHTSSPTYFVHEKDCADAVKKLRVAEEARFEAEMTNRVAANPKLAGLPRAPKDPKDAEKGTVYWHVHKESKYVPYRAIVTGSQTNEYHRACEECHQMALSNVPKGPATHCIQHGGGKRCLGPLGCTECPLGLSAEKGKKDVYDGRCVRCFCASFPDDPRAQAARSSVHAKERAVVAVLKECFPDYNWTFDKSFVHRPVVVGVRTRCRPDARFTQNDRVIIVEIDEYSHRSYLCAKEREREQSFVLQNRNKTVVMIRFNPDAYTDYSGKRIPSCFTPAEKGNEIVHVHPKQQAQWKRRLAELESTIDNLADPEFALPPKQEDRPLLICELFYANVNPNAEDERVASGIARGKAIGKKKRKLGELGAS
jgi:hypothetical protein